jgi:glycosyltransferase involved in cell wall biosynthesis
MISVIIPCYNCEKYLHRAIESVLLQTYSSYEIILVNNNSTDGTADILDDYKKKNPGIIKILNEKKPGASAARNKGLSEASGEWIQFLDADDELMKDKFERQLKILDDSAADILAGAYIIVKEQQQGLKQTVVIPGTIDVWLSLAASNLGRTSSNLWRTNSLQKAGGWNETLSSSQEYDLLFRILKKKTIICFDLKPSAFIYFIQDSISKSRDKNRNAQIFGNWLNLRLSIKQYLQETGVLNEEINKKIDLEIFHYLKYKGHLSPAYVGKKLGNLSLELPLKLRLKKMYVLLKLKLLSLL